MSEDAPVAVIDPDQMPDEVQLYPHQTEDLVTTEALAAHFAEHPELYHAGLHEHVERVISIGDVAADAVVPEVEPVMVSDKPAQNNEKHIEERNSLLRLMELTGENNATDRARSIQVLFDADPVEARALIAADKKRFEETGMKTGLYESYEEYLVAIRELRQQQRGYIAEKMQTVPEQATAEERRAVFLEALSYSPDVAERVLKHFSKSDDSSYRPASKLFTDSQAKTAASNPEAFGQALEQTLFAYPEVVVNYSHVLRLVTSEEQIQQSVWRMAETSPHYASESRALLSAVRMLEGDDAKRDYITKIFEANNNSLTTIVNNEELVKIVGDERLKEFCQHVFKDHMYISMAVIKLGKERGYIDESMITGYLDSRISKNFAGRDEIIEFEEAGMLSPELKAQLHETAVKSLDDAYSLHSFERFIGTGIVSDEELTKLLRERIQKSPSEIGRFLQYYNNAPSLLTHEEQREALLKVIFDPTAISDLRDSLNPILKGGYLNSEEKLAFMKLLREQDPSTFVTYHYLFEGEHLDKETLQKAAADSYTQLSQEDQARLLYTAQEILTPEAYKEVLLNSLINDGINTINHLDRTEVKELFNEEELQTIVDQIFEAALINYEEIDQLGDVLENIAKIMGRESAEVYANKILERLPEAGPALFGSLGEMFPLDTITKNLEACAQTTEGSRILLRSMITYGTDWTRYASSEFISNFLTNVPDELKSHVVGLEETTIRYIGTEKYKELLQENLRQNPAAALQYIELYQRYLDNVTADSIIDTALREQESLGVLGKYLPAMMERIRKADKERSRNTLLTEAANVYGMLRTVRSQGMLEKLKELSQSTGATEKTELQLIETLYILGKFGEGGEIDDITSQSELTKRLFTSLNRQLGAGIELSDEALRSLDEHTEELRTLGIYTTQYAKSKLHQPVLQEMLRAFSRGEFEGWKFGEVTAETVTGMKSKGLLPKGLTLAQYKVWAESSQTEVSEVFSVEADAAIGELRVALQNNAHYFDGAMDELYDEQDTAKTLAERGQEIAALHKELKILKSEPDQDLAAEQIKQAEEKLESLNSEIKKLQLIEDVHRLLHLRSEELRSGFLNGKEGKNRSLDQVLARIRKNIGQEQSFVTEQLDNILDSFYSQSGEVRNMKVEDTADGLVTLKIGAEPLGSCQNFRNGIMNEALLGYTDPNTKILVLRNERGRPIGRAIFRLLEDDGGAPALHLDTVYSLDISDGARRAIYRHAKSKAEAMLVPVYVSTVSQDEDGEKQEVRSIEGINFRQDARQRLQSHGSRAPYVYVDAAGGKKRAGQYTISGMAEVEVA